jgi:hypothetical protein
MQPDPTFAISCDELVEFEDDASPFAQGEPEFLNVPLPPVSTDLPQAETPSPSQSKPD